MHQLSPQTGKMLILMLPSLVLLQGLWLKINNIIVFQHLNSPQLVFISSTFLYYALGEFDVQSTIFFSELKMIGYFIHNLYACICCETVIRNLVTVFPKKPWTPEEISGMFIVSRPIRCEMKPQKITGKPQNWLITTRHETTSSLLLPRRILIDCFQILNFFLHFSFFVTKE